MRIDLKSALSSLPLPATPAWPEGVWDKTVFSHGTMSVLVFTPRGRDYQTSHTQDELYVIVKGSGTLQIGDEPFPCSVGLLARTPTPPDRCIAEDRLGHCRHLRGR